MRMPEYASWSDLDGASGALQSPLPSLLAETSDAVAVGNLKVFRLSEKGVIHIEESLSAPKKVSSELSLEPHLKPQPYGQVYDMVHVQANHGHAFVHVGSGRWRAADVSMVSSTTASAHGIEMRSKRGGFVKPSSKDQQQGSSANPNLVTEAYAKANQKDRFWIREGNGMYRERPDLQMRMRMRPLASGRLQDAEGKA